MKNLREAEAYHDIALQLGIKDPLPPTKISVDSPIEKREDVVAIYPGSKQNCGFKRWDKYDALARQFKKVVLVGKKSDIHSHGDPTWITRKWNWPKNIEFFSGTLKETAQRIAKCCLFVGNDGGLAHISAAMQIPTFVIFGPTSTLKNRPHSPTAYVGSKHKACSPCQFETPWRPLTRTSKCQFNNCCLSDLTPEDVMSVIREKTPGHLLESL
jgi:ADP-heptose:LPS heptosyltransferase